MFHFIIILNIYKNNGRQSYNCLYFKSITICTIIQRVKLFLQIYFQNILKYLAGFNYEDLGIMSKHLNCNILYVSCTCLCYFKVDLWKNNQ